MPAQILRRVAELFAGLFDVRAHDVIGLGLLLADHLNSLEITVGQGFGGLGIFGEELRRAAERVHDHRIVECGRNDLALVGRGAHGREVWFVGHRDVVLAGHERLRGGGRLQIDHSHVFDC